jgi:hypothetical protein
LPRSLRLHRKIPGVHLIRAETSLYQPVKHYLETLGYSVTMRGTNKAKEMKRRASQRRATHKARRASLRLKTEMQMGVEAARPKTKVGSKGSGKAAKATKSEKR